MLAPSGRNSASGPVVAVRMYHHSVSAPRPESTVTVCLSGGDETSATVRSAAATSAMATASACQKPPSRQPATAASAKSKPGAIHRLSAS